MNTPPEPALAEAPARRTRPRGRRPHATALVLFAAVLPLLACSFSGAAGNTADAGKGAGAGAAQNANAPQTQAAKAPDKGDFRVAYREASGGKNAQARKEMAEEQKALEETAAELNKAFSLPHDIFFSFDECGEPNAFYDPQEKKITVCYELAAVFYDAFRDSYDKEEELDDAVGNAVTFVFFHELGHALIDAYDLPVTGREEDAVDQLSVLVLADGSDEGDAMVIDAALSFAGETDAELDEMAFADEHSLDRQRFYNIICLLYGRNEKKFASLVKDGVLPEARAVRCPGEFARVEKAWDALLAPYTK